MNLFKNYLTENECYIYSTKHDVKGILVHSTGCNQPKLSKWFKSWNKFRPNGQVCVHAFIGKDDDGVIATMQTLPWDVKGWHSGSGCLGWSNNANNTGYIGFEICEDNLKSEKYFNAVYHEAVELCAYLCLGFGLSPDSIICHSEGHKKGIASNHADVMHWFPKYGKSMDTFREDVNKLLCKEEVTPAVEQIKVRDQVYVTNFSNSAKTRAYTYDGGTFRVWYKVYDVLSVSGDRIVIGRGKTITAAVNAADIERV